jgi:putative nucleotidyltransferase with HDIG domain
MEYEISPDYLPINPNSIETNTMVGFDLYILAKTTVEVRFVLYCKDDAIFDETKKEILLARNINSLFIKKDEQQKYYKYLESNFHDIMSDTRISADERSKILYMTATNLVKDLFNDPRVGNIERTKAFAYDIVDYILNEDSAANSLLKIAIHEFYTYTHSVNVAAVGTLFAKYLGFGNDDLKSFCSGILLHDIGKTRISTDILNKKGKLTKEEFDEIKKHPELGVEVLEETGTELKEERLIALLHHENDDGSGYPQKLRKDEIPYCGKIVRIIDVYDALTTNRSYAEAVRPFAALVEMEKNMLHCFADLFKEFICFLGPYDPRVR